MVEKRPYPGSHDAENGSKRPRPAPSAAVDAIAAARAKAAAKAAEIKARHGSSGALTNGVSAAVQRPSTQSPTPAPSAPGDGNDRLAAIKARIAALQASPRTASSPDAPPTQTLTPVSERDGSGSHGRSLRADGEDTPQIKEGTGPRFATALGNRQTESPAPGEDVRSQSEELAENPYFDPKNVATPRARLSRGLLFNQRGKYLHQGSKLRQQSRLEQIKSQIARQARLAGLDENSERNFLVQAPPEVEWWDEGLLEEKTYNCTDDPGKVKVDGDDSIVTIYVQHPVLLKAPQDQLLIQVKPMYLTTKEQAKLRRMRRAADLKEHQAKIRLGLEPPPPPKVKRGNMMRVMGEQAIADPTAVEMLVESQIQERHDQHVKANEDRKLTKEQRHAKIAENQQKDAKKGLHMCVFKIDSLAFGKHRYQIDHNAKEHSLTGITIFHPKMNLVIVEGGSYSIEKYKKLMLRRIKWTENAPPTEAQQERQAADPQWMKSLDEGGKLKDLSFNKCTLVFEGEMKQRAFRKWGSKVCETDGEAKEVLSRNKIDSLWALAKSSE
ncbi:PRP3-domain-containing protein [Lojkania enalia]|uniref:PRP3-domain-containing protein n=1 Tax=Lojkania enalia TaxID=147567 RepID=A0A9P4JZR6_9PLEO|nr:PRP3-domain-containing protein [Didymosphaeria enalia]